jgi:adenine-specific DNA-methyltransferase
MSKEIIDSEAQLAGAAMALGASRCGTLSPSERNLASRATDIPAARIRSLIAAIKRGEDPLGDAYCDLRTPVARRPIGATYTPEPIVAAIVDWVAKRKPTRIVDPGCGSGRFLVAAGRRLSDAQLVGVETDPLAVLLLRAHITVAGLEKRSKIIFGDYRSLRLPSVPGKTAFLGNPPYVRHHLISADWKTWLVQKARDLGLGASQLAGLHVHFYLATALLGSNQDFGAFVTAAEWLDVNYGALVRSLLMGQLGLSNLHVVEPKARPFADADTTAAIACFELGSRPDSVRLRRVETLGKLVSLDSGRPVRRERLEASNRWTPLTRPTRRCPEGFVELGELCEVHRGQVTGANKVWIAGAHSEGLPDSVLYSTITRARELFAAGNALRTADGLRRVIDIPVNLDELAIGARRAVEKFLKTARAMGADRGFIARHRKAWWSVGLRSPAPILATYMARRPPAFVRNIAKVRHINIAHGIYPREAMSDKMLRALALYLSNATSVDDGRTYSGGLTKFEPKEMERLVVPGPLILLSAPL